jgi:hypothetical protein
MTDNAPDPHAFSHDFDAIATGIRDHITELRQHGMNVEADRMAEQLDALWKLHHAIMKRLTN